MPDRMRFGTALAQLRCTDRPKMIYPPSHRFVGHVQPTLSEQIFDVAIAKRETHIEPKGVPDDGRRKLVAGKRDRHPTSYPAKP
jgi:hypothetical protein